jgi:hypothetical protein
MRARVLLILLCWGMLVGCKDVVRGVAKLNGYNGPDLYDAPCAPESLQAGHCVPATAKGGKP